jgi:hypothetical protein
MRSRKAAFARKAHRTQANPEFGLAVPNTGAKDDGLAESASTGGFTEPAKAVLRDAQRVANESLDAGWNLKKFLQDRLEALRVSRLAGEPACEIKFRLFRKLVFISTQRRRSDTKKAADVQSETSFGNFAPGIINFLSVASPGAIEKRD